MSASYRKAVEWIALNDEPTIMEEQTVAEMISVQLVSDLFDTNPYSVANAVIKFRRKYEKAEREASSGVD